MPSGLAGILTKKMSGPEKWRIRVDGWLQGVFPLFEARRAIQRLALNRLLNRSSTGFDASRDPATYYIESHKNLNISTYSRQFEALRILIREQHEKGIGTTVVNMPIRLDSLDLNPHIYKPYLETLKEICSQPGARLVDLQRLDGLEQNDFQDWHHIASLRGSEKFMQALVKILCAGSVTTTRDN